MAAVLSLLSYLLSALARGPVHRLSATFHLPLWLLGVLTLALVRWQ